jgi:glycosyltransferase involved in cell wall biosynthesis
MDAFRPGPPRHRRRDHGCRRYPKAAALTFQIDYRRRGTPTGCGRVCRHPGFNRLFTNSGPTAARGIAAGGNDLMAQPIFFDWAVSTMFGWGVYGLNLIRHWSGVAGTPAYTLSQVHLESLAGMDPLALRSIAQKLVDSDVLRIERMNPAARSKPLDGIVLHALGNRFSGSTRPGHGGSIGRATVAIIFFEDTILPDAAAVAREYDLIVTGSSWCEAVLRSHGVGNVTTVLQGIDPSLFHPGPSAGTLEGRFAVYSGGKLERRKGQDLLLLAFRAFAARHADAVLVCSWHSPWPVTALTVNENPALVPLRLAADGRIDANAWAVENGVPAEQFIDLGTVPNHLMARVLREMDVAVFPNRCEGGTNLVAMECMACGVPTILANCTGQRDIVATGAPYPLDRLTPATRVDFGTDGWGECDVEEILEMLEYVYTHREKARRRGAAGAVAMQAMSWRNQIGQLHRALAPLGVAIAA